jgi:PAS domain S-box-containing protein
MLNRKNKILLIEDNPGDARLIKEMMKEEEVLAFEIKCADRLSSGLEYLEKDHMDLILLDLGLPDSQGLDTFFNVYNKIKETPIVVLTGLEDETLGFKAVQEGAQDYLVKGQVDSKPLIRAMRYAIERKRVERRIGHLNTVLRTIRQVNQFITREKDPNRILQGVCNILSQTRGYQNAWIVQMDESGKISRASQTELSEDFCPLIDRMKRGDRPDCTKKALSQSDVVAIADPSSTCTECPFSTNYGDRGMMAVRLEHDKKIYGLLSVQASRDFALDAEEQSLFKEIGGDIAFALHDIEMEKKRKRAEANLKDSEARYKELVEKAGVGILIDDEDGNVLYVNEKAAELYGYSLEEMKNQTIQSLVHPDEHERVAKFHKARIHGKKVPARYVFKGVKKDGSVRYIELDSVPNKKGKRIIGTRLYLRDITERKRAEEQIIASLREKEILMQEIHHRVKNNMQIISSLSKLQSRHLKDEKMLELFKSTQNRVQSMAIIHDRFYKSKDLARVDFAEYVHSLANHLYSVHGIDQKDIKLNLRVQDVYLDINTAIPCGLIINELVSNSLRHAFPKGKKGKIEIAMSPSSKSEIELIVSDSGIGIPKELDFRKTESLGLHLVAILAEDQLHGKIELNREKGTEFQIQIRRIKP